MVAELIPERLDLRFGYLLQLANAETNSGGGPNSGDPENFPDLEDEQHVVTTSLAWHVYDRIDLIAGYRYEEFDNQNFFTDDIGTNLGGTDVYLNNEVGDYTAHIVTLTARVEF
jgi:hypothetical protein